MAPIELTIQSRSGKELCKLQLDSHVRSHLTAILAVS